MRIKIEFNLDDVYIDNFLPYKGHKLCKIIQDIELAKKLIFDQLKSLIKTGDPETLSFDVIHNFNSFDDIIKFHEKCLNVEDKK